MYYTDTYTCTQYGALIYMYTRYISINLLTVTKTLCSDIDGYSIPGFRLLCWEAYKYGRNNFSLNTHYSAEGFVQLLDVSGVLLLTCLHKNKVVQPHIVLLYTLFKFVFIVIFYMSFAYYNLYITCFILSIARFEISMGF